MSKLWILEYRRPPEGKERKARYYRYAVAAETQEEAEKIVSSATMAPEEVLYAARADEDGWIQLTSYRGD